MREDLPRTAALILAGRLDGRFFASFRPLEATGSIRRSAGAAGCRDRGAWRVHEATSGVAIRPPLQTQAGGRPRRRNPADTGGPRSDALGGCRDAQLAKGRDAIAMVSDAGMGRRRIPHRRVTRPRRQRARGAFAAAVADVKNPTIDAMGCCVTSRRPDSARGARVIGSSVTPLPAADRDLPGLGRCAGARIARADRIVTGRAQRGPERRSIVPSDSTSCSSRRWPGHPGEEKSAARVQSVRAVRTPRRVGRGVLAGAVTPASGSRTRTDEAISRGFGTDLPWSNQI